MLLDYELFDMINFFYYIKKTEACTSLDVEVVGPAHI